MRRTFVAKFSRNADNGGNAGGFYWNLNNGAANVNRNIGAHNGVLS